MNWYKKIIASYHFTDVSQFMNRKFNNMNLNYTDIGHGLRDESTLWIIDFSGRLLTKTIEKKSPRSVSHGDFFDMFNSCWQGRVTNDKILGKITSATKATRDPTKSTILEEINKEYVKEVLKSEFGNNLKIFWFD